MMIALTWLAAITTHASPATQPANASASDALKARDALEVVVSAQNNTIASGEKLNLTVSLKNSGNTPLVAMRPVDGSDVGWRVVEYRWNVTDAAGQPLNRMHQARCGNVNSLHTSDFVEIAPGTSAAVGPADSFLGQPDTYFQLTAPGKYIVTLTYKLDKTAKDKGVPLGDDQPGVKPLLDRAATVECTSKPLTITVTESKN
jgi:hypothetical protein